MGCNCGSTPTITYPNQTISQNNSTLNAGCGLDKQILLNWKAIVTCIKINNLFVQANIPEYMVNQLLGIIQSGLNYPDNYCYYADQLTYFQNNVLPQIVTNVPQCIE